MSSQPSAHFSYDGLRIVSYCPLCEAAFNPMEARVLGEDEQTHFLHVRCRSCGNAILAVVEVGASGVNSVGLVTDLSYEDVVAFRQAGRVTIDDVIDTHRLLGSSDFFATLPVA